MENKTKTTGKIHETKEFKGSWWIVVLWAVLLWPIAIVYYIMKCEKTTETTKNLK
jgi:hypothetical protein